MELLAVKLEKKQNEITEVYAEKKFLGSENEGAAPDVPTFEFLDPFAIKLTLLAVRYLHFPFSCHPLTRRRQLSSL